MKWIYFAFVQLICLIAMVAGWLILIPFCLGEAWIPADSIEVGRKVDRWSFGPLNYIYGNPEDGVSGRCALVWNSDGAARMPFMPNAWSPWRAYVWSGWRNSADNLKYVFAWKGGPFVRRVWRGWFLQFGWNSSGYPVISAGRI
jgi:hypothetical protein